MGAFKVLPDIFPYQQLLALLLLFSFTVFFVGAKLARNAQTLKIKMLGYASIVLGIHPLLLATVTVIRVLRNYLKSPFPLDGGRSGWG